MALDNIKEKLKKPFHRSKDHRDSSGSDSISHTRTQSNSTNERPGSNRLSNDHNARSQPTTPNTPRTAAAPAGDHIQNSVSPISESSLSRAAAPGLHNTEYKLPQQAGHDERQGTDGSIPLYLDEGRNSEIIADRNITTSTHAIPRTENEPKSQPLIPHVDPHASNVADWNIVKNDNVAAGSQDDAPQPLDVKKRTSTQHEAGAVIDSTLHHGRDGNRDLSYSVTPLAMEGSNDESPLEARGRISNLNRELPIISDSHPAPRKPSLDKPLPLSPPVAMALDRHLSANGEASTDASLDNDIPSARSNQDSAGPFNLDGVDVKKEPETVSLHEYQAPAVTHETIKSERHEVIQKVITRETHDYHIYHRILPIIDIEVKPARHFVPIQEGFVEIAEEELPGRTRDKVNWAIAEMVSKRMPETREAVMARHFTARKFEGTEGDEKEYIGPEGHPVKEKWWVYPPTLSEDAYRDGQTYPFHFGSADPKDDGLKAKLPAGNVVGVSKRLLEKRQREAEQMAAAGRANEAPVLASV